MELQNDSGVFGSCRLERPLTRDLMDRLILPGALGFTSDIVGETEIPDKFDQFNVRNNSVAPIGVNNQIMYPVPS